ncbi:MAG: hypothetical protein H7Y42_13950 [Chitinophagaceae bacterium]|nr:hypothetical protein [Chitinophagaceae bacterium]
MAESINVNFKVAGSELSSYIDSIQKKSDQLSNAAIKAALEQNNKAKENLKIIDDQIKAIERKSRIEGQAQRSILQERRDTDLRRNRDSYEGRRNTVFADHSLTEAEKKERIETLHGSEKATEQTIKSQYRENISLLKEQERQDKIQTQLAKENIDTLKETAAKNVKAIMTGDLKLVDVIKGAQSEEEKFVANLTERGLKEQPSTAKDKESVRGGLFNDIIRAENFNRFLDFGSRAAQSQNGFDMISSAIAAIPQGIATISDGIPLAGGIAKVGAKLAEAAGQYLERKAIAGQAYYKEAFRYNAVTGIDPTTSTDMNRVGVSATSFLGARTDYVRRRGYSSESNETARDAIYAEKGFGVDQGTSSTLVELQRSSRENNRDLAGLIGAVIERGQGNIFKGGDNTFLNEFLGKFATLQKELLKSQSSVPTGTTMDILSRFNKLGGEFDMRDPRSMGNINAIQQGLANPSSDNMKAMAYRILSQQNPNMGIFDLNEEMSKGLGSPGYLKGVLSMVSQIGGNDQTQMMNLGGAFKGLSPSAVRRLFQNKESLISGNISIDELQSRFPTDFKGKAESNTTLIERNNADIETQLLNGVRKSLESIYGSVREGITDAFSGAVLKVDNGKGTIEFKRPKELSNEVKYRSPNGSLR